MEGLPSPRRSENVTRRRIGGRRAKGDRSRDASSPVCTVRTASKHCASSAAFALRALLSGRTGTGADGGRRAGADMLLGALSSEGSTDRGQLAGADLLLGARSSEGAEVV